MRGLLYRELYISRKNYIGNIVAQLAATVLVLLVRLSLRCGNLANIESVEEVNEITFFMFSYMLPFVYFFLLFDKSVHISDIQSHYQLLSYTLPVTPLKQAAAKYIIKTVLFLYGLALSILNVFLVEKIMPPPENAMDMGNGAILNMYAPVFLIAMAMLLVDTYQTPLMLCCRKNQTIHAAGSLFVIPPILLLLIVSWFMGAYIKNHSPEDMLTLLDSMVDKVTHAINILPAVSPLIFVVLLAAGFGLSSLAMKRREK